jgi:hypothetical protein
VLDVLDVPTTVERTIAAIGWSAVLCTRVHTRCIYQHRFSPIK